MKDEACIYIIDDDQAVRDSLAALLESVSLPTRRYPNLNDFLDDFEPPGFGCAVVDLRMREGSGLMLQERMNEMGCDLPLIFISAHADVQAAVGAMKNGAFDFLAKPVASQMMIDKVHRAVEHHRELRKLATKREASQELLNSLTQREQEVMKLLITGASAKQVAKQLDLSPRTVEMHRTNVLEKLEADSVVGLLYQQWCLSSPDSLPLAGNRS